jgi:hypothetical protein
MGYCSFTNMRGHAAGRAALVFSLALAALMPISCAAVDDGLAPASKSKSVMNRVQRANKVYTYSAARDDEAAKAHGSLRGYLGSAPWICSPSGFGQKSRCFARPSI